MIARRNTKQVMVGRIAIGQGFPISIQSMTKTDTADVEATSIQVRELATAGCEIVRIAVPDADAAEALFQIRKECPNVALVADIHFHPQFAVSAIDAGFDKIRWNPGNIRDPSKIKEVVDRARERKIAIRIGVNVGSLDPECEKTYSNDLVEAIVQSGLKSVRLLESLGFYNIVISLKSSDVFQTIESYRRMTRLCDYPFHLGVTEAGLPEDSIVKSSIGIGALLVDGIGDTLRVSMTGDPVEEVQAAKKILSALEIRKFQANIIACPSCGRCEIDLVGIANQVRDRLAKLALHNPKALDLSIAVMGCVVNGPGESSHADVGLAGGKGAGIIYRKGKQVRKVSESEMVDALFEEVQNVLSCEFVANNRI